jgi:hypothetical protein
VPTLCAEANAEINSNKEQKEKNAFMNDCLSLY